MYMEPNVPPHMHQQQQQQIYHQSPQQQQQQQLHQLMLPYDPQVAQSSSYITSNYQPVDQTPYPPDEAMQMRPTSKMPYPTSAMETTLEMNNNSTTNVQQNQHPSVHSEGYNFNTDQVVDGRKLMNTQTWMRDHRFYGVAQQRANASASSMMSRMTQLTSITEDPSLLSVNTQISDIPQLADLRKNFYSSAPSPSSTSCVENVDPKREKYSHLVNTYLDKIISGLSTTDKKIQYEIMRIVFTMTVQNDFERADAQKLETMMYTLMQRWLRQNDAEQDIVDIILRIMSSLSIYGKSKQIMAKWMANHCDEVLETFLRWMDPSKKFCKYALNTVHSLLDLIDKGNFGDVVRENILNRTLAIMKEIEANGDRYFIKTSKSKQYVFDLVRRVYNGSDPMRKRFEAEDGLKIMLELLKKEMNEIVVYRIVRAIYALICSQDRIYGMRFVSLGGVQVISHLLANPYCSDRISLDSLLCLRAVSDLKDVRMIDNRSTIVSILRSMDLCQTNPLILMVAVDFLGNVAANTVGIVNVNKDIIVQCNAIDGFIRLMQKFLDRRHESNVKNLFGSIIWGLHILSSGCSSHELVNNSRKQLIRTKEAPTILLHELANSLDLTSRLYVLNLFLRIVEADQLNHPSILFNTTVNNNSFTDVLFEIIATSANTLEANGAKPNPKKIIIQRAYALLAALANCNLNFATSIRFACGSYQIWELLLSSHDSDVLRSTIEFLLFVVKDETVREHLSKDCNLVEAIRSLSTQMNDNSVNAQFLLYHLTAEAEPMANFTPLL